MKNKIFLLILLLMFGINCLAQLGNLNLIQTTVPKRAVTMSDYTSLTPSEKIQSITYFDGLGRPIQKIANAQSTLGNDIVTHMEYDSFGRIPKEYLPFPSTQNSMGFINPAIAQASTNSYYTTTYGDFNGYSEKLFEASPLNRIFKQAAPGNAWAIGSGHEIKFDYQTNMASEVKWFKVTNQWVAATGLYNPSLSQTINYDAYQLYKTIIKDENWLYTQSNLKDNTIEEFKNKEGQVVLKRTFNVAVAHDNYYVYDDYGNLTYVLPPKALDLINPSNVLADITSTTVTSSGNNLSLTATNSIVLLPGFHAQSGSTFTAKVAQVTNQSVLDNLCYQYKYDHRNRLVEKKLPGKDWEYIVYDKLDRPVLTQDANLRTANKWLFTKYDAFSRPVYTGEYTNNIQISRFDIQTLTNNSNILVETKQNTSTTINNATIYYSNNAFPNTNVNLFTINYYDDYTFDLNGGNTESSYTITPITNAKSLPTGSKVRILETNFWITNITYYDDKARPVYTYSNNDYLGTIVKLKSKLDFIGKTLETTTTHTRAGVTTTVVDAFAYDNYADRLLTQKQKINNQTEEVIASNVYDELGKLISKGVGGKVTKNRLQTLDYSYNVRGWLKKINDVDTIGSDLFAFQVNYNDIVDVTKKLYNGNISQTLWKTNNTDSSTKNYIYTYDSLNRLTDATDNLNIFNESLSYDKNGNIITLNRKGEIVSTPSISRPTDYGTMDNLTYSYDGNKLQIVSDAANKTTGFKDDQSGIIPDTSIDYTYDANGNMKTDTNKAVTAITYNHLNLPTQVTLGAGTIQYTYDATGVKQRKVVNGITTDYAGGFQYENNIMRFFPHTEGYAENNSGIFSYIYHYKDHLGNIRLSYQDKNNDGVVNTTEIMEESNYYHFGLKHSGYNNTVTSTNPGQKLKYNGKELQDELGLNLYDYGARNYDPALGRWMNIDPLAEVQPDKTPYHFCSNNPVNRIDPTGMLDGDIYNLKGEHIGNDGVDDNAVYVMHTNSSNQLTEAQSKYYVQGSQSPGIYVGPKIEQKAIGNDELNLRASLSTLKQTEAGRTNAPLDYNTWNNNKNFTEDSYAENPKAYSDHPGKNSDSGGSAAGAYQFLDRFYNGTDFSPKSQDAAAVNNMTSSSFTAAKSGSGTDFKTTTQARWTSLKHFTADGVQKLINTYRAQELKGNSNIATPVGELIKTRR
jgi:RHS repeat-associated protein